MALGFLITFTTFADIVVRPMPTLSTFVLAVRSVLASELVVFMIIFVVFMAVFGFGMYNGKAEEKKLFKEYWIVDPRELHATKANHIELGVVESMPKELNLNDVD